MDEIPVSVLITRPEGQAQGWCEAVELQGWQALAIPMLEIVAVEETAAMRNLAIGLHQYKAVICISPNAARLGLELLANYWPQWPVDQAWYAVGEATARVMQAWQLQPQVPDREDAAGVLKLAGLQHLSDQRVLLIKGVGGREVLQQGLRAQGLQLDELVMYERRCPSANGELLREWLHQGAGQKILTVSSGEVLTHLYSLAAAQQQRLLSLSIVVVSERLMARAQQMGFSKVVNAGSMAEAALISACQSLLT